MSIRVNELVPGDRLDIIGVGSAIFVARANPHPLYESLELVIWWLVQAERWSFDALSPIQVLYGDLDTSRRKANLRRVLLLGVNHG